MFAAAPNKVERPRAHIPPRDQQIQSLKNDTFDVLIIGGGATGVGCALDSCTRGMILILSIFVYLVSVY